jgi:hypothetical protein
MAVAAPKRRSAAAPAPAPSRTTAPKRRKASAAPARQAPVRRPPARKPPQRARPKPKRAATQPRLALVVGRTAATVRDLPDSGLIVRMTRGRAWIAVLGVLLVGIVALNVVTLSFAASLGKIDEQTTTLEQENSSLGGRLAQKSATPRIHYEAATQGLVPSTSEEPKVIEASSGDAAVAASRLAAAGG